MQCGERQKSQEEGNRRAAQHEGARNPAFASVGPGSSQVGRDATTEKVAGIVSVLDPLTVALDQILLGWLGPSACHRELVSASGAIGTPLHPIRDCVAAGCSGPIEQWTTLSEFRLPERSQTVIGGFNGRKSELAESAFQLLVDLRAHHPHFSESGMVQVHHVQDVQTPLCRAVAFGLEGCDACETDPPQDDA